jgi:hypothetical protein
MTKKESDKYAKSNKLYNFYEHKEVKKLIDEVHNPCYDVHQLQVPFRLGIVGSSGAGKTSILLNLINKCRDTFGFIHVVYKASEPLYEFLEKSLNTSKRKVVIFYKSISELPPLSIFPNKGSQQLIVFDDQVNERCQDVVKEIYIRGRKLKLSAVYLSQSYYKIPRIVRLQFGYLFLLKLSSGKDLQMIMQDCSLGDEVDKETLYKIYKDATNEKFTFLKIDLDTCDPNRKFSKNFNDFYKLENVKADKKTSFSKDVDNDESNSDSNSDSEPPKKHKKK